MPLDKIIRAGMKAKEMYDAQPRAKTSDPEIPVPGRKPAAAPVIGAKGKANMAADMFNVPGRNAIRSAAEKRRKALEEM